MRIKNPLNFKRVFLFGAIVLVYFLLAFASLSDLTIFAFSS